MMEYDEKIPDYAMQPARSQALEKDGSADDDFDPAPYDKLIEQEEENKKTSEKEAQGAEEKPATKKEETDETETVRVDASESEDRENEKAGKREKIISETRKITPLDKANYTSMKMTDIVYGKKNRITLEEDILVPDVKPDMLSILSVDGKPELSKGTFSEKRSKGESLRITGELSLQVVYVPVKNEGGYGVAVVRSVLPFKTQKDTDIKEDSFLRAEPDVEEIEYSVINERKFRIKAVISLELTEYAQEEIECFQSLAKEKLEMLTETLYLTNVALRKKDVYTLEEELLQKEGQGVPEKILKYNADIVENHKQITGQKAVINAVVICNIMYIARKENEGDQIQTEPCLLQTKVDFTQFIPLDKIEDISGSKVIFDDKKLSIDLNDGKFMLMGDVETEIEIYQTQERELVTDLYHSMKNITYDYSEKQVAYIKGRIAAEVSAREIVNVPEGRGQVEKVIFINGRIKESRGRSEQHRNIVEGTVAVTLLCIADSQAGTVFALEKDMAFRGAVETPYAGSEALSHNDVFLKDLWFDKINGKQIEVNAGILVNSTMIESQHYRLIRNLCLEEDPAGTKGRPAMTLYITGESDSLWEIAKRYGTTKEAVREINGLGRDEIIEKGKRLLIVR